ncbi:MAG: hypothetical protein K6F17_08035 [Lachnospiraceae bacterium]|nr:hypothetical protein [Lachnospiraceae bacterium]
MKRKIFFATLIATVMLGVNNVFAGTTHRIFTDKCGTVYYHLNLSVDRGISYWDKVSYEEWIPANVDARACTNVHGWVKDCDGNTFDTHVFAKPSGPMQSFVWRDSRKIRYCYWADLYLYGNDCRTYLVEASYID